jgi:hypothetical protein
MPSDRLSIIIRRVGWVNPTDDGGKVELAGSGFPVSPLITRGALMVRRGCSFGISHMESSAPKPGPRAWAIAISGVFAFSAAALLVGKLIYAWPVDAVAVVLFLVIWIPAALPLLRRLKYKDIEIDFIERTVKQVQAEVATLANQTEIEREKREINIEVDPYKIRLRYTSEWYDDASFNVTVWLDAPPDFLAQVRMVIYEGNQALGIPSEAVHAAPFRYSFRCRAGFTIHARITLNTGQILRRQKDLQIENSQPEAGEDVE